MRKSRIITRIIVSSLLLIPNAWSKTTYGNLIVKDILKVYDGDTFRANLMSIGEQGALHPVLGTNISIRVNGIDTPEIRGKCDSEKELAQKAKAYTKMFLNRAEVIELRNIQRGKYFRLVADVYDKNVSLAASLHKANLGYVYYGNTKRSWCVNK